MKFILVFSTKDTDDVALEFGWNKLSSEVTSLNCLQYLLLMCAWCLKMLSLCAHWVLKRSKCLWTLLALHSYFPLPRPHFHSCCDSVSNRPQSTMTPHRTQTHRQWERRMRGKPLGGSERNFKGEINCRGTLHCESDMKSTPSWIWDLFLSPSRSL